MELSVKHYIKDFYQKEKNMWDERFIKLTDVIGEWSKDPSTRVGAVIVDKNRRIISAGYNGYPRGIDDTIVNRDQKILKTIHAEANAIMFARQHLDGCTIYINFPPCSSCAASIVQSGITRVVFKEPQADFMLRWGDSFEASLEMFHQSQMQLRII